MPALSPSPGTPGEGWGGGDRDTENHAATALHIIGVTPTSILPRRTRGGGNAALPKKMGTPDHISMAFSRRGVPRRPVIMFVFDSLANKDSTMLRKRLAAALVGGFMLKGAAARGQVIANPPFFNAGATAFEPVPAAIPSGVTLPVHANVSADRKVCDAGAHPTNQHLLAFGAVYIWRWGSGRIGRHACRAGWRRWHWRHWRWKSRRQARPGPRAAGDVPG